MKTKLGLTVLTAFFLFLFSVSFLAVSGAAAPGKADKESILEAYGKLPLNPRLLGRCFPVLTKEAYGQLPLQDFNLLEQQPITAYGHHT